MQASVVWKDGMAFEAHLDGFNFFIDADETVGGQNKGPKPKGLTLVSLAGCTAMDVISILKKMRVSVDSFEVAIDGVIAQEHPRKFLELVIKYIFKGTDLPLGKIENAITLSMENYCGVSATLRPTVKLSHQIIINGQVVESA
jgi:putative redox protein